MTDEQVCETVEKYGANREECARLNASLSCLRNVHKSGEQSRLSGLPSPQAGQPLSFKLPMQASTEENGLWIPKPALGPEMSVRHGSGRGLDPALQRMAQHGSWIIMVQMWESWLYKGGQHLPPLSRPEVALYAEYVLVISMHRHYTFFVTEIRL